MTDAEEAEVAAWLGDRAEQTIETACARVFLAGGTALKIKRRVDLGYADFSTPERRRWALERELEFNRATAPDVYRGLRRITREADGALALDGTGETVELALEMRRFDQAAVLAARPEMLDGGAAEALGRRIARLHAEAPVRVPEGPDAIAFTVGSNAKLLRGLKEVLGASEVEALIAATDAALAGGRDRLAARAMAGFSRRSHGDLHLGNIFMETGAPVIFDCIEFSDRLSDIDVLYDLAFLLMDLDFRGRREAAVRVLSGYLDQAARTFPAELWSGLCLLPLTMSVRAAVRAHVMAHGGEPEAGRAYLAAALAHLSPRPAALAAVGGLSGSGKTRRARQIAPQVGPAPGAVILRSDEIRKRLAGVAPTQALPAEAYAADRSAAVHDAMFETARALLAAGRGVVLDATFLDPRQRARAEALAAAAGVAFEGWWLEAPLEVLEARVAARSGDASDADLTVLRAQAGQASGPITWRRIDAAGG